MLSEWNKFPVIRYSVLTILYYLHDSVHLLISIVGGWVWNNKLGGDDDERGWIGDEAKETGEAKEVSIAVVRRGCFWIVVGTVVLFL